MLARVGAWLAAGALRRVEAKIDALAVQVSALGSQFGDAVGAIAKQESLIMAMSPQIQKLVDDTTKMTSVAQSAKSLVDSIPQMIKDAVASALAANPSLSADDLAAVTQVATDLENASSALATSVTANTPAAPAAAPSPAPAAAPAAAPTDPSTSSTPAATGGSTPTT